MTATRSFERLAAPATTLVFAFLAAGALLAAVVGLAKNPSLGAVCITLGYAALIPVIVAASRNGPHRWLWAGIVMVSAIAIRVGSLDQTHA